MMQSVYSWLMWVIQPLLRSKLRRRGLKEPGYLEHIEERFGIYARSFHTARYPEKSAETCVWVHAVSLGETRAAEVLLQALRSEYPDVRIVLTHGTATGRTLGATLLKEGDVQVWQPWDTPAIVQKFLQHFQPNLAVVLETEVWPNWVAQCKHAHIPMVLVNARMSEKSMLSAQRLAWLSRPAYAGLNGVWAQTPDDAKRLELLGAPVMEVLGNVKFDAQPNSFLLAQALLWSKNFSRPVVLLASSREGEEDLWLDALPALTGVEKVAVQRRIKREAPRDHAVDTQPRAAHLLLQFAQRVVAHVSHVFFEVAHAALQCRHHDVTAGIGHRGHIVQRALVVVDMFDNVRAHNQIERLRQNFFCHVEHSELGPRHLLARKLHRRRGQIGAGHARARMGRAQDLQQRAFAPADIENGGWIKVVRHAAHQPPGVARHGPIAAHVIPFTGPDGVVIHIGCRVVRTHAGRF